MVSLDDIKSDERIMLTYAWDCVPLKQEHGSSAVRGRRARDLNPALPRAYWMHGRMLLYQGKAHNAAEEIRQALQRTPDQFKLVGFLGYFLYYEGKTAEAEQAINRAIQLRGDRGGIGPLIFSAYLHAARGERDKIDSSLLKHRPADVADGDVAEWIGDIYALLGDKPQAIAWLRRAVALGDHNYPWFQRNKNYENLRGDRDFEQLMREVGGGRGTLRNSPPGTDGSALAHAGIANVCGMQFAPRPRSTLDRKGLASSSNVRIVGNPEVILSFRIDRSPRCPYTAGK